MNEPKDAWEDPTFIAALEEHDRVRDAAFDLLEVCQEAARVLRFRLINASPWGADLVEKLETAIKKAGQQP